MGVLGAFRLYALTLVVVFVLVIQMTYPNAIISLNEALKCLSIYLRLVSVDFAAQNELKTLNLFPTIFEPIDGERRLQIDICLIGHVGFWGALINLRSTK